ncbi:hypothetical protein D3C78_1503800 [compost metagenome]
MMGGMSSTSGGTNHSGTETISAISAISVEPSDQARLASSEPPFLRSSCANRRSATRDTSAGVMHKATTSKDSTTMMGMATSTTSTGATAAEPKPTPLACNQPQTVCSQLAPSSRPCTHCTAGAQ